MHSYGSAALQSRGTCISLAGEQAILASTVVLVITISAPETLQNVRANQMINNSLLALFGISNNSTISVSDMIDNVV